MARISVVRALAIAIPLALTIPFAMTIPLAPAAFAASQGIVAVVNDIPITGRDLTQRIALMKTLGDANASISRKDALRSLIDEQVKITEATKYGMMPSDREVDDQIGRIAKNMGTSADGLSSRLKKQGIGEKAFKRYVSAMIGFNRIISSKNREQISVTDVDVDAKYKDIKRKADAQISKIMNDPRMKAVTVYQLMEISLPVDGNDDMLLQARAVEAVQVLKRFNGCGNAKAAASGVFNVKFGKTFEADAAKLPKQMRAALDKVGAGKAVGPMLGKQGVQLIAFCGRRTITPPKPDFKMPTREQVRRMLINEKYDGIEEEYLKSIRGNVYVEYRDAEYAQQ